MCNVKMVLSDDRDIIIANSLVEEACFCGLIEIDKIFKKDCFIIDRSNPEDIWIYCKFVEMIQENHHPKQEGFVDALLRFLPAVKTGRLV